MEQKLEGRINDAVLKATLSVKTWAEKKIDDKIAVIEKKFDRKIQTVKDLFSISGYIGLSGCVYQTFGQFVEKQFLMQENFIKKFQDKS